MRIDLGVENLFDKMYFLPLGGAYAMPGHCHVSRGDLKFACFPVSTAP
jgi:hypothetical protein